MIGKGIIVAMVTPFDCNGEINEPVVIALVERFISNGVAGIFILGTNGEFYALSREEKLTMMKLTLKAASGRIPVCAGTGCINTEETVALSCEAKKIGVDALSLITPFYMSFTQNEVVTHYKRIADKVDMPIILYNMPRHTNINIAPDGLRELAAVGNIIGIKDSSGSLDNMKSYIEVTKDMDFSVLSGSDSLILSALESGASGAIAATANLIPEIDVAIYNNFLSGNYEDAKHFQDSIEILRLLTKKGTGPSVLKRSLVLSGIDVGIAKSPIAKTDSSLDQEIKEMLNYYHKV